ncbi:MAG: methylmalonyl-CoA carboxyltransferase, partial [Alphaproteobacteria bacterium]|nr:methylmalonyl-CoA carboxyltransferase [Alphaproteobacteria bacterium]
GLGAARTATSHFAVMVQGISQMFIAGPPVVARAGETLTKEELGGADIHARAGAIDLVVESEDAAFAATRRFLSYLPSSVDSLPPRATPTDDPGRREEALLSIVPRDRRKVYQARKIVEACVDQGSFFELGKAWGRSLITGLARLDGWPVAVVASDPYHYGGAWTAESSLKVLRFLDMAETFHLPVVHFVDCPGFLIGKEAERQGTIRHGSRALAAVYQATVPWCSILIRKSFGVAGAAHCNATRLRYRYAWPSGDWGSLPLEGGIEAAYKAEIAAAPDPKARLAEIEARLNQVRSPFRTAETFGVEDIVDPRDTRKLLCEFANLAAPLRRVGPSAFPMRP